MAGILLGDESKITSDIERDFKVTGTSHIIPNCLYESQLQPDFTSNFLHRHVRHVSEGA